MVFCQKLQKISHYSNLSVKKNKSDFYMKFILFLFFIIFSLSQSSAQKPEEYKKTYLKEYQSAIDFLKTNQKKFLGELGENQGETEVMVSVVFPEMVRFSEVSNLLETASLEMLYVRFGANYADFSIGRFQMKPSFVEKMEKYIEENKLHSLSEIHTYSQKEDKEIRQERINRLKKLEWQLKYLRGFYEITRHKFVDNWNSKEDKIRFFAAAYNRGFDNTQQEIEKWINLRAFPFGVNYRGKQYIYAEICTYFYLKDYSIIFN